MTIDMNHEAETDFTRRDFVKGAAAFTASAITNVRRSIAGASEGRNPAMRQQPAASSETSDSERPARKFRRSASAAFIWVQPKTRTKRPNSSSRALDAGVNFFDNAWDYHDGLSEERLGIALRGRRDQAFVMTKVCTHGRGKDVAMQMLEQSLRRLQTDHLDLWQIHEVIYYNDPDLIFAPGGAAEALDDGQAAGQGPLRRLHGPQRSGDSPAHASRGFSVRYRANAAQCVRRQFQELRNAGRAGSAEARGRRARNEKPRRFRRNGHGWGNHGAGRFAIRDELARRHDDQRHGFARACLSKISKSRADFSPCPHPICKHCASE